MPAGGGIRRLRGLMCIKSVFESINSIRHNGTVRKAIAHVYDTITEKNSSPVRIYILQLPLVKYSLVTLEPPVSLTGPFANNLS